MLRDHHVDNLTAIGTASSTPSGRGRQLFLTECIRLSLKSCHGALKRNVSERRPQLHRLACNSCARAPQGSEHVTNGGGEIHTMFPRFGGRAASLACPCGQGSCGRTLDAHGVETLCCGSPRRVRENARDLHMARGGFPHCGTTG